MKNRTASNIFFFAMLTSLPCLAKGPGTSAGLTLLDAPNARAASLGEAFTAAQNDVAGFAYNPAAMASLEQAQTSLQYHSGIADDSSERLLAGFPLHQGGLGFSLSYYDGGTINIYDGVSQRKVTAQKDVAFESGYARQLGNKSVGLAGKFFSSQLIESSQARAFALDFGAQMALNRRIHLGAALQNIGTRLSYDGSADPLARVARAGAALSWPELKTPVTLFLDAPYFLNEKELRPAAGVEVMAGPVALRAGYHSKVALEGFTFGAGFKINSMSLDYSFGMVDQFDTRQRVSLTMSFGPKRPERSDGERP